MKIETKDIVAKLQNFSIFIKTYVMFVFVLVVFLIFSFFVFRINQINNLEPTATEIEEKLQTVQRPKIDKAVLDKIEQLQGQNIEVRSLFDQARKNPFSE